MSKLTPKYTAWEAISAALAVGMRALEEVRTLARTPGKDGERGAEGPPGKLPPVDEWRDRVYYESEVVTLDGAVFQALRDTGRPPHHEDWRCIVRAGRDGRSLDIKSTYVAGGQYRALDMVALNGGQFVAKRDNPGVCPGEDWQLMASQGKQGKPGERGAIGPKGERGASVVGGTCDAQGMVTFKCSDGTEFQVDMYPALSRLG